jgi:ABC-type antimicrobial peptide transport system permease subunit
VTPAVRQVLREIDPNLPIINVRSLDQVIALGLLPQRVAAWIVGVMGLVGVLLASIGIYGVTTHAVTSRTREIGIRIALGAKPNAVLRLILHEGFVVSAIGLVLGLAGGVAVGQFIRSYLYGVAPTDLIAFGVATLALAAVALLASYLPARRATAVDPMVALRRVNQTRKVNDSAVCHALAIGNVQASLVRRS